MRIFSQGMSRVSESDYYARAVMLAESKLAQLGADIPLEDGEVSGESEGALHWRVRLAAYDPDSVKAAKEGGAVQAVTPVRLLQVEVDVSWAESQAAPRSIRLTALKLAPRSVL
jgi:general secretion pathway protein I